MRHPEKTVRTIGELVDALRGKVDSRAPTWFRGQPKVSWPLLPSLARKDRLAKGEAALIKRFKQNAVSFLPPASRSEFEWLFLMQHYRLPTRLLDWTESPLTALFFAVEQCPTKDGALWCLDPIALNEIANIKFDLGVEIPAFDHDDIMDNYLPTRIASEKTSKLNPIAAMASRNSPRISAQLGVFTITHRDHLPIESLGTKKHVWRLRIPAARKKALREELSILRLSKLTLFPELDQVATHALETLPP